MTPSPEGDEQDELLWRRAYAIFEEAMDAAPDRREALARERAAASSGLLTIVLDLLRSATEESLDEAEPVPDHPPGACFGRYEITGRLGRGAMGRVYAARDSELGRIVALKFLVASSLPADRNPADRLVREAKAAAALNHPNIVTIFDVVREGPEIAIAMELVEGRSLREHCEEPQTPELVIHWGRQIAEALAATHAMGIVHRDIKPENVMIRHDRYVKVLDFGLARRAVFFASGSRSTLFGRLAGTPDYMSPEQGRGERVEAPTDIFSLGAVLYELVCGRHPFHCGSPIDTAHAICYAEPEAPSAVRPGVPAALSSLLIEMLAKHPAARPTARDVAARLASLERIGIGAPSTGFERPRRIRIRPVLAAVAVVAVVLIAFWYWRNRRGAAPGGGQVLRYSIPLRAGYSVKSLAISPEGDQIAYSAAGPSGVMVYRRFLDSGEARAIPGSEGGEAPFFSPDARQIGFFLQDRIRLVGESGQRDISAMPQVGRTRGGWTEDGFIYFDAYVNGRPVIARAPARGGAPESVLNSVETSRGYAFRIFQERLPDGILYAELRGPQTRSIDFLDQADGSIHRLIEHGMGGQVLPTGHLLYYWNGSLMAAPYNARLHRLSGSPAEVASGVAPSGWMGGAAQVSTNGTLVYVENPPLSRRQLLWLAPGGRETALPAPVGEYEQAEVSPDGLRVGMVRREGQRNWAVWILDLKSGVWMNLLESRAERPRITWSPDSRSVVVGLAPDGAEFTNLYRVSVDARDTPERLIEQPDFGQFPTSWSRAANAILFLEGIHPGSNSDILLLPLSGDRRPRTLVATPGYDRSPSFSADGRWFTYATSTDGHVYVQDVAQLQPPMRISDSAGGLNPLWSSDGKRIYYIGPAGLMEVAIKAGKAGTPRRLFARDFTVPSDVWTRGYSVAPDGRFLVIREVRPDEPVASRIQVVVGWFSELKRLVPTP